MTDDSRITAQTTDRELARLASTDEARQELEQRRRQLRAAGTVRAAEALIDMLATPRSPAELDLMTAVAEAMLHHPMPGLRTKLDDIARQQAKQHSPGDLVTQLGQMLTDAEARDDRAGAAWARYSLAHAIRTNAQMQAVADLLLALIPERERGALTALVVAEAIPRITAAVDAAVAEAKRVADELTSEADHG
ncbi:MULTISPECIES: hypothetical protein [Tsukamurella]|uniref:Uncharacterized protein n=2 Tax=Tsukamurella TaxID=2060 RepID=A0A5C5RXX0_9ACTN|nr:MULTISPECIES: hypothetical protein [Tsukamurella]NMD56556.1 hypothetical protein [Tsukamurella columbiensis]TWS27512.1 hypothetical protein FK530_18520 [Tsukamurella conjunctivitidis]